MIIFLHFIFYATVLLDTLLCCVAKTMNKTKAYETVTGVDADIYDTSEPTVAINLQTVTVFDRRFNRILMLTFIMFFLSMSMFAIFVSGNQAFEQIDTDFKEAGYGLILLSFFAGCVFVCLCCCVFSCFCDCLLAFVFHCPCA